MSLYYASEDPPDSRSMGSTNGLCAEFDAGTLEAEDVDYSGIFLRDGLFTFTEEHVIAFPCLQAEPPRKIILTTYSVNVRQDDPIK